MPVTTHKVNSRTKAKAVYAARRARSKLGVTKNEPAFSSGVAAVGAAAGALAGFLTPLPGATAMGFALGGMLGKIGAQKYD